MLLSNTTISLYFIVIIFDLDNDHAYFSSGLSSWSKTFSHLEDSEENKKFFDVVKEVSKFYKVQMSPSPTIASSIEDALHSHRFSSKSILIGINPHTKTWETIKVFESDDDIKTFKDEGNFYVL